MELLTGFEAQWPNMAQREQFTEHLAMRLRMARFKQRIDPKSKRARPMKAPWLRREQPDLIRAIEQVATRPERDGRSDADPARRGTALEP
jgi:hypothetical protein